MSKPKKNIDEQSVINDYLNGNVGTEQLALKYGVGKLRIRQILDTNNVQRKKRGGQKSNDNFIVPDWKTIKYVEVKGKHYIAIDEKTGYTTTDINNKGGYLTTYIKNEYGVTIPTLYERRLYYMRTGNYWWEQWFTIKLIENAKTKKCPYCEWSTIDVENNSGWFEQHLNTAHHITKLQYLEQHPEDREYFRTANKRVDLQMETDDNKFVVCKICGSKLKALTAHHLQIHNITKSEYIERYGVDCLIATEYYSRCRDKAIEINKNAVFTKKSNEEIEIEDFIKSLGFQTTSNRQILKGREIDIYIPSLKIGFEYNGNMWHTERYGKDSKYHVSKTNVCEQQGIHLIQIFDDEFHEHKDIVLSKIRHILQRNNSSKIYARKCIVKEIFKNEAEIFLNQNHIQGFIQSTVYLGAYNNGELVAVMTFLNENYGSWNLTRLATDIRYNIIGIADKLFKYFLRNFYYEKIKSFADRRWSWTKSNVYINMGFHLEEVTQPEYRYYNSHVDKYKRFHKFGFRKQILHKKYGLPLTMTELEMTKALGYDRIWDCGLLKYVYTNPDIKTK